MKEIEEIKKLKFGDLPKDYKGLCLILPPRIIYDDEQLSNTEEVCYLMAGHKLTDDQEDYLDIMSYLIVKYEKQQGRY